MITDINNIDNLSLIDTISDEAAQLLYERMSKLGKVNNEPFNHYQWSHHPTEFLPANVCCDLTGHAPFVTLLRDTVAEVLKKHISNKKKDNQ